MNTIITRGLGINNQLITQGYGTVVSIIVDEEGIHIIIDKYRHIRISKGDKTIEIQRVSIITTTAHLVSSDVPFFFDGDGGNTYFMKNSTTNELELYVNGVLTEV